MLRYVPPQITATAKATETIASQGKGNFTMTDGQPAPNNRTTIPGYEADE